MLSIEEAMFSVGTLLPLALLVFACVVALVVEAVRSRSKWRISLAADEDSTISLDDLLGAEMVVPHDAITPQKVRGQERRFLSELSGFLRRTGGPKDLLRRMP